MGRHEFNFTTFNELLRIIYNDGTLQSIYGEQSIPLAEWFGGSHGATLASNLI